MKMWTCPFQSFCGDNFFITPPDNGEAVNVTVLEGGFGFFTMDSVCPYMVSFPSTAVLGDQIAIATGNIKNCLAYLLQGPDYTDDMKEISMNPANLYLTNFPEKSLIVLVG